jgi:Ca2+-binding RTX toxin-like protein
MSRIDLVDYLAGADSQSHSRITDLLIVDHLGTVSLFSVTRYDGLLQQWDVSASGLALGDALEFDGALAAGGTGSLAVIPAGGGLDLLTGGVMGGGWQGVALQPDLSLGAAAPLMALPAGFDTFQHPAVHTIEGVTTVYGSFAGQSGIGRVSFDTAGTKTGHAVLADPAIDTMAQISAVTIATVGGQAFLVTASTTQNGIAARSIAGDGSLGAPTTMGTEDGLWISAPSVLASAELGGATYLILGAAGSQSLSVIELDQEGGMILRDHLMDSRDTRFAGITAIEVVEKDGKTYVIAGGADDGVSVFVLIEGGVLIHRASLADTDEIGLDNISAIAASPLLSAQGLDLFVASSSEVGVTHLRYQTGQAGITTIAPSGGGTVLGTTGFDVLHGLSGDDILSAGAGDDILTDGAGSDMLAGGAGADVFLLSADGRVDTITDFQQGEDRIDLSLWPLLRDISQLTMRLTEDGMEIRYGDELLIVQSADGNTIDYRTLSTTDLIGGARLSGSIQPGYPGPPTPAPDPNGEPPPQPPTADLPPFLAEALVSDAVFGAIGGKLGGQGGSPTINGTDIGQVLIGTDGDDLLIAKAGDDTVDAGAGSDLVFGGAGDDFLLGGDGGDRLIGGLGNDTLKGGAGDDWLSGGSGTDKFVFNAGHDIIDDFASGEDTLELDTRLWTGLTSAADLLQLYASTDSEGTLITFDTGDTLFLENVFDFAALAEDMSLF